MIERIKDFLYDISDILLAIVIIASMVFVISWKISDAMDIDIHIRNDDPQIRKPVEYEASNNNPEKQDAVDKTEGEIIIIPEEDSVIEKEPEDTDSQEKETPLEVQEITIEIPRGSTATGIAKILKEKGIIENQGDFIKRVEELGLGPKLRFGTFTIKSTNTIDEIIHILTGTN